MTFWPIPAEALYSQSEQFGTDAIGGSAHDGDRQPGRKRGAQGVIGQASGQTSRLSGLIHVEDNVRRVTADADRQHPKCLADRRWR